MTRCDNCGSSQLQCDCGESESEGFRYNVPDYWAWDFASIVKLSVEESEDDDG